MLQTTIDTWNGTMNYQTPQAFMDESRARWDGNVTAADAVRRYAEEAGLDLDVERALLTYLDDTRGVEWDGNDAEDEWTEEDQREMDHDHALNDAEARLREADEYAERAAADEDR